jgi:chromosome partitioning protein
MKQTAAIMFANNKGGVGKTTTSLNTTAALAEKGKSVIYIDFDESTNSTHHLIDPNSKERAFPVSRLLMDDDADINDCIIWGTKFDGVGLIQGDRNLKSMIFRALMDDRDGSKARAIANRFCNHLEALDGLVDFIIVDVNPSMDMAVALAMSCTTHIIYIADECSYSEEGIINMINSDMHLPKEPGQKPAKVLGALYNKLDSRQGIDRELMQRTTLAKDIPLLPMYIPRRSEIASNTYTKEFAVKPGKSSILGDAYRELADYLIMETVMTEPAMGAVQ